MRQMLATDLMFDPTYAAQRETATYLIGALINTLRSIPALEGDQRKVLDQAEKVAIEAGIISHDPWHHAPRCPANNWSETRWATSECSCGAARREIR